MTDHSSSNFLRGYPATEADLSIWRTAFVTGNSFMLPSVFGSGITANDPIHEDGRHPLIDVALHKPQNATDAFNFAALAQCLIEHDAILTVPDYKGLLPADYALASPNSQVAAIIALATLRQFVAKLSPYESYRPNLESLFITTPYEKMRRSMYERLLTNYGEIRNQLADALNEDDLELSILSHTEQAFWEHLVPPPRHMLPRPPQELTQQFQAVAFYERSHRRNSQSRKADTETGKILIQSNEILRDIEKTKLRNIEWRITKDLRP